MTQPPHFALAPDGWTAWPPRHRAIDESIAAAMRSGDWGRYHSATAAGLTNRLADQFNAAAVRLVCSGTAAIELAVRLCLPPQSKFPPRFGLAAYDYPGVLRTVELAGGRPVLVDTLPDRPVMDPAALNDAPDDIVAVIASDLHGHRVDLSALTEICQRRGWRLIHDACQAPAVGLAPVDFRTLSFGGSKPITGGCGGALLFDSARDAARCNGLVDRPSDTYSMSPLAAAAVLPQLGWLDDLNRRRADAAARLDELAWHRIGCRPLPPAPDNACHYKYPLLADDVAARDRIMESLQRRGVPAGDAFRDACGMSSRRVDRIGNPQHSRIWGERLILIDGRVLLTGDVVKTAWFESLRRS